MGKYMPRFDLDEFMTLPVKIRITVAFHALRQALTDRRIIQCYEESLHRQAVARRRYEQSNKRKRNKNAVPKIES